MKTLFLAWQDGRFSADREGGTRAWFPIGRLDIGDDAPYQFAYTGGAKTAAQEAGFQPLEAFPKLDVLYKSAELFPLFKNRLISEKRDDYAEYVDRLGLHPKDASPFEILGVSGGTKQTDNLEVFPKLQNQSDGTFSCRFFLHGWRHVNPASQERTRALKSGDPLMVSVELNNPATGLAIQMESVNDYFMLGWAPRYLIHDLLKAIAHGSPKVQASVVLVNPPPAPQNQRVLVELRGTFPPDYQPMSGSDFQPLVSR